MRLSWAVSAKTLRLDMLSEALVETLLMAVVTDVRSVVPPPPPPPVPIAAVLLEILYEFWIVFVRAS